ncbi:MAG: autotransporter domain-containing protein [Pseudomonas sp.]
MKAFNKYTKANHAVAVSALALAVAYAGLHPQQVVAQEWTGAGIDNWFDAANWSTGSVPTIADTVTIDAGAATGPLIAGNVVGIPPIPNAESAILIVGADNTGTLRVWSGTRRLETADTATLGANAGSLGLVYVDGPTALWRSQDIVVANQGTAELDVTEGGEVEVTQDLMIGLSNLVGRGDGTLRILGRDAFTDKPSEVTVARTLYVGFSGTGRVEILDGAVLRTEGIGGVIGWGSTGEGYVRIDAAESQPVSAWINNGVLEVGGLGQGALELGRGGLFNDGMVRIGARTGSSGSVVLIAQDEAADPFVSMVVTGNLWVGDDGEGSLLVGTGRIVGVDGTVIVGDGATGSGEIRLFGAGSALITSDSEMILGNQGNGELWINQGARLNIGDGTGRLIVADGPGSTGVLVIGALPTTPPGLLELGSIEFGAGDGTIRLAHGATDYELDAALIGNGTVQVTSGTTIYTGDGSLFSGAVNVSPGNLVVNSTLNGVVTVNNMGTLSGNGSVGSLNVNNGGTVAPGNSIGTLNVLGDVAFAPGSVYVVEVNGAGDSDRIQATGTATLNGGTVQVTPFPDFALDTPYSILVADGGLIGPGFTEATLEDAGLFVAPQLSYDGNTVFLVIEQSADFADVALTRNQRAAAGGIQSVGAGPLYSAIAVMGDPAEARRAFDAISGEVHASLATAMLEDSRIPREAALRRLANSAAAEGAGVWIQVLGSEAKWRDDGNAARLSRDLSGVLMGVDGELGESGVRAGIVGGYTDANLRVRDRSSSAGSENWHLGGYAGTELTNGTALRGGAVLGWHSFGVKRQVAVGAVNTRTSTSYDVRSLQAFGEVSHGFDAGTVKLEPLLSLAHVHVNGGRYSESGEAAALRGKQRSSDATFVTAGIRTGFPLGARVEVSAMPGVRHVIGSTPKAEHRFASGGDDFVVAGTPLARNVGVLELGIHAQLTPAAELGLFYNGQMGSGHRDHALHAGFSMKF